MKDELKASIKTKDTLASQIPINVVQENDKCSQHPVGGLDFHYHLESQRAENSALYELYLEGETQPFHLKAKIPSERLAETANAIINHYVLLRDEEELFGDFLQRVGQQHMEDFLHPFTSRKP